VVSSVYSLRVGWCVLVVVVVVVVVVIVEIKDAP